MFNYVLDVVSIMKMLRSMERFVLYDENNVARK